MEQIADLDGQTISRTKLWTLFAAERVVEKTVERGVASATSEEKAAETLVKERSSPWAAWCLSIVAGRHVNQIAAEEYLRT